MSLIKTITLELPLGMGSVNCYLLSQAGSFLLIDTGIAKTRTELVENLDRLGCGPENLKLVVLTHGDFDHTGNATYLRQRYNTRIAMGKDDWGMLEQGDMFYNRKRGNALFRWLAPQMIGFTRDDRCTPDIDLQDGADLSEYGFSLKVLSLPGHSKGSIGLLTPHGELFSGDLFGKGEPPRLNDIMDNPTAAHLSLDKLRQLEVAIVYPGHGKPFSMAQIKA